MQVVPPNQAEKWSCSWSQQERGFSDRAISLWVQQAAGAPHPASWPPHTAASRSRLNLRFGNITTINNFRKTQCQWWASVFKRVRVSQGYPDHSLSALKNDDVGSAPPRPIGRVQLAQAAAWQRASPDDDITIDHTLMSYPHHRRSLQGGFGPAESAKQLVSYARVVEGTCESNHFEIIITKEQCKEAASAFSLKLTWGPSGGYTDVVDGCSIRGSDSAFQIDAGGCVKGSSTPDWVPGAHGKATCACTEWQPCLCIRPYLDSYWGSAVVLLIAVVALLYVGGGIIMGRLQRGGSAHKEAGLLGAHPHITKW
jgi:hypothetical protein